jgi:DNA-binding XRE family transcriptional regulator
MLVGFHLRAARAVCKLTTRDLGKIIGISHSAISLLEQTPNLKRINCSSKTMESLLMFFHKEHIIFPNHHTISFTQNTKKIEHSDKLTVFQYRAARSSTKLPLSKLSEKMKVSTTVLIKLDHAATTEYIKCLDRTVYLIKSCFERNGIVFVGDNSVSLTDDPELLFSI